MITFPNAKINLGLNVLRKRVDGYHDISTVMIPVPWCDILEVVPADNKENDIITVYGNELNCPAENNLVLKSLHQIESYIGKRLNVKIFLDKIIPDGAGLGGGSSDASFMANLLNDLFKLGIEKNVLKDLVGKIGADCPFFIDNKPCLVEGIGDRLKHVSLPLQEYSILIVKPPFGISTAQAYAGIVPRIPEIGLEDLIKSPLKEWHRLITNDFENVAFKFYPELRYLKESLYDLGAIYASMSGSGSAFYGFFKNNSDNLSALSNYYKQQGYTTFYGKLNF